MLIAPIVVVGLAAWILLGAGSAPHSPARAGSPSARRARAAAQKAARRAQPAAVESGLLPWRLSAPISREIALPGRGRRLVLLGGLNGSTSANGIFSLDTGNGGLHQIGTLHAGVHDAAGAIVGGRGLVFGGGSPATTAAVQEFPAGPSAAGALPTPRSDAQATTIGHTTYVVGGFTGSRPDPTVLATTNGRTFQSVAALPVPVRYPAVAALGGKLYVFGGESVAGPAAGPPVNDVQVVDPATRTAKVVAHLPEPLEASAAVVLGGTIYLAGGDTSARQRSRTGVGTTQLEPQVSSRGSGGLDTLKTIWAFDPSTGRALVAGSLQVPVSHAGVTVLGSRAWLVGGESGGTQLSVVQMIERNASFGTAGAPGAGSPYFGAKLLIADRANNRLLLMSPAMKVEWRFPSATTPHDRFGFYFPDDAFFIRHGTAIITNQEQNETLQEVAFPSGRIVWEYGHPKQSGTGRGYLHEPDDAYLLPNGQITVADAFNCRVLVINNNRTVASQIGTNGVCSHNPPSSMGTPNGDTPLADGNLLVSEITGSWISEYTRSGRLVWT
ncbi:MAG: hypothetical protein ACRDSS_02340, partial [Actinocrinis sp.]